MPKLFHIKWRGVADTLEANSDSDGDGTPNFLDLDSDADSVYRGASLIRNCPPPRNLAGP